MANYRTEFKYGSIAPISCVAFSLFTAWGAYFQFTSSNEKWVSIGLASFSIFGVLTLVEVISSRLKLTPDEIQITQWFKTKRIPVKKISDVSWEKGCGVTLKMKDGNWEKIPSLGKNSQGLTNSIRACIKMSNQSIESMLKTPSA